MFKVLTYLTKGSKPLGLFSGNLILPKSPFFAKFNQTRRFAEEKVVNAEELHGVPEWITNKGAYIFRSHVPSTQAGSGFAHSWRVRFRKQPKWLIIFFST